MQTTPQPQTNQPSRPTTWVKRPNHKPYVRRESKPTTGTPAVNSRTNFSKNNRPSGNRPQNTPTPAAIIPPLAKGDIRIIPLGGTEEIGRNMTMIEYNDQIVVIDAGVIFSNEEIPGVNYIIPNVTYLRERKHMIKAMVITHGHLDHIGSIPFVITDLGNPPIYTREFGSMLIKKRQEEYPDLPELDIRIVARDDGSIRLSDDFKVRFFGLTHSIPDSTGVIIETPHGDIVSTGDVRVENIAGVPTDDEVAQYKLFKDRKVLLMTMDSTGIPFPGWSLAESIVVKTVDDFIRNTSGRLLIATFASQVERIIQFIKSAKHYGRYVVVEGRSMKTNIGIVKHLGLTDLGHVIDVEDMHKYPMNKILILATGGQGEQYSLLDRVSRDTHKFIKLNKTDTIIFSSSVIPGNDRAIDGLKDRLYKKDPTVITYADTQVHSSGHGKRDELAWLHTQIDYKFFMPVHGSHFRLKMHRDLAVSLGASPENIVVPENGSIIEIRDNGNSITVLPQKAVSKPVVVDGLIVGEVSEPVMRDRKVLSEEGFIQVVVAVNQRTGKLYKSPDIISRGFIYLRDNQELLHKVRILAKKTSEDSFAQHGLNIEAIKDDIIEKIKKFVVQKTAKRPIVIAVVLVF